MHQHQLDDLRDAAEVDAWRQFVVDSELSARLADLNAEVRPRCDHLLPHEPSLMRDRLSQPLYFGEALQLSVAGGIKSLSFGFVDRLLIENDEVVPVACVL